MTFPNEVPIVGSPPCSNTTVPRELKRFQQLNAVRIQGVLPPPVSLDQALTFLETEAKGMLPAGYTIDYAGQKTAKAGNLYLVE